MNLKELKELLQLMAEHDLSELEVEKDGTKIKLRKGSDGLIADGSSQVRAAVAPLVSAPAPAAVNASAETAGQAAPDTGSSTAVKSPMVGTFYSSPAPDQPPYVSKGQAVKEGDVLCIIEAMKLMNEIKSEVSGVIEEILIENGQPVEFDQSLFRIAK